MIPTCPRNLSDCEFLDFASHVAAHGLHRGFPSQVGLTDVTVTRAITMGKAANVLISLPSLLCN